MLHTHVELTAILEQMIDDEGTTSLFVCLHRALCNKRSKAYLQWKNERTADEMAREWDRQASLINAAVQGL